MNILDELKQSGKKPVNILHGPDWWTDCDDVVAMRILCRAHEKGLINLKCVCADAVGRYTAASIDGFIKSEGIDGIPVGVDKSFSGDDSRCRYQKRLSELPHTLDNDTCPDSCKLYRKMLWESEEKCHITEVGFPQIIHQLMVSEPDEICPLDGMELVKQKVEKIWMMAGDFRGRVHREYNVVATKAGFEAMKFILDNSPVPVTCLGFEAGETVITGGKLKVGDTLYNALADNGHAGGRCSWDPMTVLLAVIGDEEKAGYEKVCGTAYVDSEGYTIMNESPDGLHAYVVKKHEDSFYENMIDEIIESR